MKLAGKKGIVGKSHEGREEKTKEEKRKMCLWRGAGTAVPLAAGNREGGGEEERAERIW